MSRNRMYMIFGLFLVISVHLDTVTCESSSVLNGSDSVTSNGSDSVTSNGSNSVTSNGSNSVTSNGLDSVTSNGSNSVTSTAKSAYGPSSASLTFQHPGPIYFCPSQQTLVDIKCQVPEGSFNPSILFTIREGNNNSLITQAAGNPPWKKSVQYTVTRTGQHTFTCRAENAISRDIFVEAPASSIQVYAPPQSPASIQVTGEYVVTDDSGAWVKKWSDISVSCSVAEGNTSVKSVLVKCKYKSSSSGPLSIRSFTDDEINCHCSVDYETKTLCDGFNLNSTMSIKTTEGPNYVMVSFVDDQLNEVPNKPLNLCSSEGLNVTVICAVKQSDVRPELTINDFTLTKHNGIVAQKVYLADTRWGEYTSVNQLKINTEGNHILICEVRNPIFPEIKISESITIEVRKPPSEGPVLTARSIQHGNILVQGDDVTVICAVFGGFPSVYTLSLICGRKRVIRNESSVRLSLNKIGLSHKETHCTCQATHVTGCYDKMEFFSWTVLSVHPHQARKNLYTTAELAAWVIGISVGAMMIVIIIATIVLFKRTRNGKCKNRNEERDFQAFGDYINPVQPNLNSTFYSGYIENKDETYTTI